MKKSHLKDEGNALKAQKHQLNKSQNKLTEIDNILSNLQSKQEDNNLLLDDMLLNMEVLLETTNQNSNIEISEEEILNVEKLLEVSVDSKNLHLVTELDNINFDENMSWKEYLDSIEEYGIKHNLNLKEDPYKSLMTKSQQVELQKRIKDEFTLKNAQCDKYDYMIAGTCGVISGLVDILFVGAPGDSKLGKLADEQANKITEKFAEFLGWDKEKVVSKGNNTTASAIDFLEGNKERSVTFNKDSWLYKQLQTIGLISEDGKFKGFKVNYDQTSLGNVAKEGKKLSTKNHHLKSLGHSPDLIGLLFSIFNQFTNTSSFIIEGKLITIDTESSELYGSNLVSKVFCGFANWFGHIMSDWSGSNGTVGNGNRGTGVPIPFYNLFQMIDIGSFKDIDSTGSKEKTFAQITEKIFKNGYDARHGMAMAIPVLINELLIRFMYTMKARFYHQKEWQECIPKASIPEVRRMLFVGHGVLCIIDGTDAYVRSGSGANMVELLSRTNLIAWARFGQLALREVYAWHNSGHIDAEAVDEYITNDLKRMLK